MQRVSEYDGYNLSVKDAAAYMNVSQTVMYALCSDPDFYPAFRIGRKVLVNKQDLDSWRAEQQKAYSEENKRSNGKRLKG